LYSSNSLYAAKEEARENPNRKPITLTSDGYDMLTTLERSEPIEAHLPRMPPIGFLGLGATPTCAVASSRRTALDDSNRVCIVRDARRAIRAQAIALSSTLGINCHLTTTPISVQANCSVYIWERFPSTCS
jgi:hypothetical protein